MNRNAWSRILLFVVLAWVFMPIISLVVAPKSTYLRPYLTENAYLNLKNLYEHSQYRLKDPTSIIADEIVFRYASLAYMRGEDPILINSEHTPLGKYLIGLSFYWFRTDVFAILFSAILSLAVLYALSKQILHHADLALVPIVLFVIEPLFQNQLRVTPLLDIIQLPFILLSLYFFLRERTANQYMFTSIALGLVASTKSIVPSVLLVFVFLVYLGFRRYWKKALYLIAWLPLGGVVLVASYSRTFLNGYTLADFLGFQKWIVLYQKSKLVFPFSFWRLTLFNQWQTWWGEMNVMPSSEWWWTWPVLVLLPIFLLLRREKVLTDNVLVLVLWALVYELFLSVGIVSTRFLLPLLPSLYILLVYTVSNL